MSSNSSSSLQPASITCSTPPFLQATARFRPDPESIRNQISARKTPAGLEKGSRLVSNTLEITTWDDLCTFSDSSINQEPVEEPPFVDATLNELQALATGERSEYSTRNVINRPTWSSSSVDQTTSLPRFSRGEERSLYFVDADSGDQVNDPGTGDKHIQGDRNSLQYDFTGTFELDPALNDTDQPPALTNNVQDSGAEEEAAAEEEEATPKKSSSPPATATANPMLTPPPPPLRTQTTHDTNRSPNGDKYKAQSSPDPLSLDYYHPSSPIASHTRAISRPPKLVFKKPIPFTSRVAFPPVKGSSVGVGDSLVRGQDLGSPLTLDARERGFYDHSERSLERDRGRAREGCVYREVGDEYEEEDDEEDVIED